MTKKRSQEKGSKQTVLIVDDEELLAQALAATLDVEGLQTVVGYSGEDALTLARTLKPDLILLDVMMPDKSGIEVCATLKTDPATSSIPVILVTAKAEQIDRAVGLAAGADEYMTKPFSPTELVALVKRMLAGQPVEPPSRRPDLSAMPTDQLVIYARELKEISEQERLARQELEKAHRRLGEVDRLKAAFLGVVTHELLTPFSDIGMALEVLQWQSKDSNPDLQSAVDDLATNIAGLHRLIGGVVKFAELVSKRREPHPAYISLDQVVPWAVQPVAVLAQARDIDFRVFVPSDLPQVHADPELLAEAIFQMAHNAVKFNLPEGWAHIKAFDSKGWVVIKVEDTGVGLSPEQLELLKQPFGQSADALRRGQEGLGIGWTFVRYVTKMHGGRTRVESPGPGQGSIFYLALPVAGEAPDLDAFGEAD